MKTPKLIKKIRFFLRHPVHSFRHYTLPMLAFALVVAALLSGLAYAGLGGFTGGGSGIDLQSGLIGHWKLDNNANDSSPGSNHGVVSGATPAADRQGNTNGAYSFDGTNDYISVNKETVRPFSLSFWMNANSTGNDMRIISNIDPTKGASGNQFSLRFNNNRIQIWSSGWRDISTATVTAGQWVHVVVAINSAGNATGYINGSVGLTVTDSYQVYELGIGSRFVSSAGSYGAYFSGRLDDVRLYNRALTANEAAALHDTYEAGVSLTAGQKGIVGHWKLDGNTYDSTPYSSPATNFGATPGLDRKGQSNKAYQFNGSSHYMTVPDSDLLIPTSQLTMSVWYKRNGSGSHNPRGIMISKEATYIDECYQGQVLFSIRINNVQRLVQGGSCPADGEWRHYAATYDGLVARLYINGAQVGSYTETGSITDTTHQFFIGRYSGGGYFVNGSIDDVRIYDRALSQAEIAQLTDSYDANISISDLQKQLVGRWMFDGNAYDSTPYSRHGSLSGQTALTADRRNRSDSAFAFDGAGDFINAGPSPITGTSPFTMAAWINTAQLSQYSGAFAIGPSGSWQSAYIGTVQSAQNGTSHSLGGGFYGYNMGSGVNTLNAWAHVALTFSGGVSGSARIYVNGQQTNVATVTPNLQPGNIQMGRIGTDTIYDFSGKIDDVRLWSRELSDSEIEALYNSYN